MNKPKFEVLGFSGENNEFVVLLCLQCGQQSRVVREDHDAGKYDSIITPIPETVHPSKEFTLADLKYAWEEGFARCRAYADNHAYFEGAEKDRQFFALLARVHGRNKNGK